MYEDNSNNYISQLLHWIDRDPTPIASAAIKSAILKIKQTNKRLNEKQTQPLRRLTFLHISVVHRGLAADTQRVDTFSFSLLCFWVSLQKYITPSTETVST